ncbi:hypothetical protein J5N97_012851 [Dioscorea zingiberensis]|uniref:Receptor-like serine/threonine-protein kinase n=1 Tax=Dioscorea zingiberensis TaxID=325984 RepID=A0A9D5CR33_9LILI|nr:hypothetical protein J5N97_012851 [Dioscorea zingiberensis]
MLSHTTTFTVLFSITILMHSTLSKSPSFPHYSTTSNLSSIWINTNSFLPNFTYPDGTLIRPILLHSTPGPSFACGFYCTSPCNSYLFSIFIVFTTSTSQLLLDTPHLPPVVWSANRHHSISDNATLQLTATGDLVLRDSDSSFVWSSNTSSISVVSMQLLESGNLILANVHGDVVWSSFDHPTDTLLLGQSLREGQRLTANASATDWTPGRFFLTVHADSLAAYINSNPPQLYYQFKINNGSREEENSTFIQFFNGSLALFGRETMVLLPSVSSPVQHITLESDGHLRLYYEWKQGCKLVGDVLIDYLDDCDYPLVCGDYGVCSKGQCSCPRGVNGGASSFFRPVNELQPNLGCSPATSLSCQSAENHAILKLDNVSYFNSIDSGTAITRLNDEGSCKEACLNDCTCKAAFFKHGNHDSYGSCYMPSQLFSMMSNHSSSAYIKIQMIPTTPDASSGAGKRKRLFSQPSLIIGSVLGALFVIISGLVTVFKLSRRKVTPDQDDIEDNGSFNGIMRGLPTRFSLKELRVATKDFWQKLGEGGFGKNLDNSLPEESNHLIGLLQKLVESDELLSIVDNRADIGRFSDEVVEMMKLAMWCLQTDASRRPSMSMVVKVLDGVMRVESDLNYDFSLNPLMSPEEYAAYLSAQQFGSILSGPR